MERVGLQHTWEEHSGKGVRSPQVVNEDALEGLTAGRLLVPAESRGVGLGWSPKDQGHLVKSSPLPPQSCCLDSEPSSSLHCLRASVFSSVKWDNSLYCTRILCGLQAVTRSTWHGM